MNSLRILVTVLFVAVCNVASQGDLGTRCFSCGYVIEPDGTKQPNGDVPFCGDFASDSDNIVEAGIVSLKY